VGRVLALGAKYKDQLATAATLDAATQTALSKNPGDSAAITKAVGQIAGGLHIAPAAAIAKLQALAQVPKADLSFLSATATPVQAAAARLTALGAVPAADLAFLTRYGTGLKDPKVLAALAFLQREAPGVQQAALQAPGQWQRWWWICFACQLLFLPCIWLLSGRWSPARARADAYAHDEAISRELATLANGAARA